MSVFKISANQVNRPSYEATHQASTTWDGEYAYSPELYQREETDAALTKWRDYQELESGDQGLELDPDDALDDLDEMEGDFPDFEDVDSDLPTSPADTAQLKSRLDSLNLSLSQLKIKIQTSILDPEIKAMLAMDVDDLKNSLKDADSLPDPESLREEVEALGKDFEDALKEKSVALANEKAEKAFEDAQKAKEKAKEDKKKEEAMEPVQGGY